MKRQPWQPGMGHTRRFEDSSSVWQQMFGSVWFWLGIVVIAGAAVLLFWWLRKR